MSETFVSDEFTDELLGNVVRRGNMDWALEALALAAAVQSRYWQEAANEGLRKGWSRVAVLLEQARRESAGLPLIDNGGPGETDYFEGAVPERRGRDV